MDDIKKRVKEKEYRNWVKSTLGLGLTKEALHEYVKQKFKVYIDGKARLNDGQQHLDECDIKHIMSGYFISCLKESAVYNIPEWKWSSGHDSKNHHYCKCDCDWQCACEAAFTKILSLHRKGRGYKNIYWENSANPSQIPLEWLVAKMFMPQGNKETNKGPEDTDPYAMFKLMQNCLLFSNFIKSAHLKTLKNARNTLFHSPDNLVKDEEQEKYFEGMIILLSDASNDPEVPQETRDKIITDIAKITTLKESDITLTVYDDLQQTLLIKRNGIHYDFYQSLCEKEPDLEKLKHILQVAEQIAEYIAFVEKHLHDFKHIERYKNEIDELRKQRDHVKDLAEKIPPVVEVIKEENRQLLAGVNLLKTECTSYVDEVQTKILEELKHVPSNEKMTKLRNDAIGLSEGLKDLKQNVQGKQKLSEGFETMRVEIGQWQRALRVKVSQLESEGVIVVIIVVVVMSWLLRILLFIG